MKLRLRRKPKADAVPPSVPALLAPPVAVIAGPDPEPWSPPLPVTDLSGDRLMEAIAPPDRIAMDKVWNETWDAPARTIRAIPTVDRDPATGRWAKREGRM